MIGCSAVNFFSLCTFYTDAQYFTTSEFKHRNVNVYKEINVNSSIPNSASFDTDLFWQVSTAGTFLMW
jgi:hypothetical protein